MVAEERRKKKKERNEGKVTDWPLVDTDQSSDMKTAAADGSTRESKRAGEEEAPGRPGHVHSWLA